VRKDQILIYLYRLLNCTDRILYKPSRNQHPIQAL